ncbi:HAD-IIIA family hydrolase [Bdellovibrionota bacterium]
MKKNSILAAISFSIILLSLTSHADFNLPTERRSLGHYECPEVVKKTKLVKVAFFDADSTLRVSKSGSPSANYKKDVVVLPFVAPKIRELNNQGFLVAVISNQGGVSKGFISRDVAEGALLFTAHQLARMGAKVDYFDFAENYDKKDIENGFRKPAKGMGKALQRNIRQACKNNKIKIDLESSFMVGDSAYKNSDHSSSDRKFAENFGIKFFEPKDFFGWIEFGVKDVNHDDDKPKQKLNYFLEKIEEKISKLPGNLERHQLEKELSNIKRINKLASTFRFVHYNIKELTTEKLEDSSDEQVDAAIDVLIGLNPDLLSINELQYDLPFVPTTHQPDTTGENVKRILERVLINPENEIANWSWTFAEANTGKNAKKIDEENGDDYYSNPSDWKARANADLVNFGIFPGQYSTGFATHYPITERKIFTTLTWKEWNPEIDFSNFRLSNGTPLPEEMEFFDKNFNHTVVNFNGTDINIITFHTVPAFGFGNDYTPNFVRNRDQLEFLERYLAKLGPDAPFVAVGDLNVDRTSDNPGAVVINRFFSNPTTINWMPRNWDPAFEGEYITYLSDGVDLGEGYRSQLDYFIISKHFKILTGEVSAPRSEFEEHGCFKTKAKAEQKAEEMRERFSSEEKYRTVVIPRRYKKNCVVSTTTAFHEFRKGSDHLPIYVDLELRD